MNGYTDVHSRVGPHGRHETRPVAQALREMDQAGVQRAWIAPADALVAVRNREGNDFLIQAVRDHPDRFIGCAVASPWFGPEAVCELRRAFESGLRVLFLHPPVQGFQLSDPLVDPLIDVAEQFHAPVYAHTGTPICSEPFQLATLARRHPRTKFIMGHMGFADFWYDAIPAAMSADNLLLETSLIDDLMLTQAAEKIGPDRIVFGSDAPISGLQLELDKIRALPLPSGDLEKILRLNSEKLLP